MDGQHVIELAKIVDYLLNDRHPTGHNKAAYFRAFGFSAADPLGFAAAVEDHARTRPVVRTVANEFGVKTEVRCRLTTPDGRDPCVVAIWLQANGSATYRLITVYPADR